MNIIEQYKAGERSFVKANLRWANLSGADLRRADLRGANLRWANLRRADLRRADLREANLSEANLRRADLRGANLSEADLRRADLRRADLREANLSATDLRRADLRGANLSEAIGLLDTYAWINKHCELSGAYIYAYKTFGGNYTPSSTWRIEPGAILTENVNPNPTEDCGCGINVSTLDWQLKQGATRVWKVRIDPGTQIVVPYHTDGTFRVGRVVLVEEIDITKIDKP